MHGFSYIRLNPQTVSRFKKIIDIYYNGSSILYCTPEEGVSCCVEVYARLSPALNVERRCCEQTHSDGPLLLWRLALRAAFAPPASVPGRATPTNPLCAASALCVWRWPPHSTTFKKVNIAASKKLWLSHKLLSTFTSLQRMWQIISKTNYEPLSTHNADNTQSASLRSWSCIE